MFSNKAFWWIALLVNMGIAAYWHTCHIKELCNTVARVKVTAPATVPAEQVSGLSIRDGDRLRLEAPGNFSFARTGAVINLDAVRPQMDELAAYLKTNPGKKITITGLYASSEENNTTFANLGLARADALKRYLMQAGAAEASIEIGSRQMDDLAFSNDSLRGGLGFDFGETVSVPEAAAPVAQTEQGLAEAEKFKDVFQTMDLYFPSGKADYIKTPDNRKFLQEAQKYLKANPDKKLALTGHTDSEGPNANNLRLSQKRADAVKTQFAKLGIATKQLVTDGKGETAPKAANNTPAGRRANRRVSIVVQ